MYYQNNNEVYHEMMMRTMTTAMTMKMTRTNGSNYIDHKMVREY